MNRVKQLVVAALASATLTACTIPVAVPAPGDDAAPPATVPIAPLSATGFPTDATTGVPAGTTLTASDLLRSSDSPGTSTRDIDGHTYKVFSGLSFDLGDTGNYFEVDDPYVLFENCRFTTSSQVSNDSAVLQGHSLNGLRIEHCSFDGGPYHNRGVQSDYGVQVFASNFTRTGNAAVEMNNRGGDADLVVRDSYISEPSGWCCGAHVDGIQVGGGRNVTIANNTVRITPYNDDGGVSNSALGLWAELGDVTGAVLVEHNWLGGGGRVMYLEQKDPFSWQGPVTVRDNVFAQAPEAHGGIWGILYPSGLPGDLTWIGNIREDGTAVSLDEATATY